MAIKVVDGTGCRNADTVSNLTMRRSGMASFLKLPWAMKALAVEAAICLALARFLVVFVRLRRWRHRIATAQEERSSVPALAWKVAWVVPKVANAVPFTAVCLQQAIAAQWMLRRRGVASQLTVGARREAQAPRAAAEGALPRRLSYHAWLQVSGQCVVGCKEISSYAVFPPFESAGRSIAG